MRLTEEKVEHLCSLTGLDEEHIREALEENRGDELETLAWLERRGSVADAGLGFYSTAEQSGTGTGPLVPVQGRRALQRVSVSEPPLDWGERIWLFLVGNRLVATKRDDTRRRIECPLGALLALLVIAWYVVVVVLLAGLVLGWRYRLAGPQLGADKLRSLVVQGMNWLKKRK